MNDNEMWAIIDTETTGLRNPVYPVEISAQTMRGWNTVGDPWTSLLNFNVPIDPFAEKMHGYSREYLREYGAKPMQALQSLADYLQSYPLVAYNLPFDWSRVLAPTIERMHIRCDMQQGFCALNLTRNVVPAMPDFKLKTVITTFGLAEKQIHHATDDVSALSLFLSKYVGPHLTSAGVIGYKKVVRCAQGMITVPPLEVPAKQNRKRKTKPVTGDLFAIGELVGICRAIAMDRHITDEEVNFLAQWLENCPRSSDPPFRVIYDTIHEIVSDGQITEDERSRLSASVDNVIKWKQEQAE